MPSRKSAAPTQEARVPVTLPDLRLLRAFVALSNVRNMTAAAKRLGLTQSAVSQSIRHLEEILGTVLIDRSSRPLTLTPAGSLLHRQASALIEDADALVAMVRHSSPHKMPELRMGVIDSFGATVGPSLIKSLLASATRVAFRSGLAQEQARALLARELDLIVTSDAMDDVDGLERQPLLSEPFLLLVPAELSERVSSDLKELANQYPLVRFSLSSLIGSQVERHLRRLGVRAPRTLEVDATDTLTSMVSAGVGWAIATPLCLSQVRSQLSGIRAMPFPNKPFYRQLFLIWRAREYGEFPRQIAERARKIISEEVLPALHTRFPWLKGQLNVD
jgi:DNA-binding transcriptional LysR family regulator